MILYERGSRGVSGKKSRRISRNRSLLVVKSEATVARETSRGYEAFIRRRHAARSLFSFLFFFFERKNVSAIGEIKGVSINCAGTHRSFVSNRAPFFFFFFFSVRLQESREYLGSYLPFVRRKRQLQFVYRPLIAESARFDRNAVPIPQLTSRSFR